jgi:hypothetical protein
VFEFYVVVFAQVLSEIVIIRNMLLHLTSLHLPNFLPKPPHDLRPRLFNLRADRCRKQVWDSVNIRAGGVIRMGNEIISRRGDCLLELADVVRCKRVHAQDIRLCPYLGVFQRFCEFCRFSLDIFDKLQLHILKK